MHIVTLSNSNSPNNADRVVTILGHLDAMRRGAERCSLSGESVALSLGL